MWRFHWHVSSLAFTLSGFTKSEVTVTDNEAGPAPSHHHAAVTRAVGGCRAKPRDAKIRLQKKQNHHEELVRRLRGTTPHEAGGKRSLVEPETLRRNRTEDGKAAE